MNRRQFSKSAAIASALLSAVPISAFNGYGSPVSRNLKKGMMWGGIKVGKTIMEKFQAAKLAGFEELRLTAISTGMRFSRR